MPAHSAYTCTQLPDINVAITLIFQYVRALHADEDAPEIPYRQTQFGVVLMVDVVGTYMKSMEYGYVIRL